MLVYNNRLPQIKKTKQNKQKNKQTKPIEGAGILAFFETLLEAKIKGKGTNVFSSDFSGLLCFMQLYTRLHLSDYRKF